VVVVVVGAAVVVVVVGAAVVQVIVGTLEVPEYTPLCWLVTVVPHLEFIELNASVNPTVLVPVTCVPLQHPVAQYVVTGAAVVVVVAGAAVVVVVAGAAVVVVVAGAAVVVVVAQLEQDNVEIVNACVACVPV
jgi:hypothetical protein